MIDLTDKALTEWSRTQGDYSRGPEFIPNETPWGEFEWAVDEGRDRDNPSVYYIINELNGRFFRADGYYSSWDGTDWSIQDWEWVEVEKKTRTEEYWGEV